MNLFSNFTYFLEDPVNGDQFHQPDKRTTSAVNASHTWQMPWGRLDSENTVGIQFQNDNIFNGLYNTQGRQTLSTTRADHIVESSVGIDVENATRWTDWFRTIAGVRSDSYRFNVRSDNAPNSGKAIASIGNPKLNLNFGPWAKTEYCVNMGGGFHSNDARGATIAVDPKTGNPADKVPGIVRAKGHEVGMHTSIIPGLQTSLSLYQLDFASELIFAGDAGTTEAGRPSRRNGFEFANCYKLDNWLTIDADLAFSRPRFNDADPGGNRIPGSVEGVASVALALDNIGPYFGALQRRYCGPRPLIEDNSVRPSSTATFNGRIGYKINKDLGVELAGYNLTDRKASAIDYFYTSRLQGEPAAALALTGSVGQPRRPGA